MPAATGKGLTPKSFGGLSKTRSATSGGSAFPRVKFTDKDPSVTVQFFGDITDETCFKEFEQHQWRDKHWNYVACLGKKCPLCEDEDEDVAKSRYRFVALVYNLGDKQVQVLEGPSTMAQRIILKYERKQKSFSRRAWDITRLDTTPVSYDVDQSDDDPVDLKGKKKLDLQAYIDESAKRYFGKDVPRGGSKSALDDDDDYEDDETYTKAELMEMRGRELKEVAEEFKIKVAGKTKQEVIKAILRKQEN